MEKVKTNEAIEVKKEEENSKTNKIKELKGKKKNKIIITSIVVVVVVLLIIGVIAFILDVNGEFIGDSMISSDEEISEDKALDIAINRFEELGEENLEKSELEILKILRKDEYYYYISSPGNTLEVRIKDGKIVRENSVLVEE